MNTKDLQVVTKAQARMLDLVKQHPGIMASRAGNLLYRDGASRAHNSYLMPAFRVLTALQEKGLVKSDRDSFGRLLWYPK